MLASYRYNFSHDANFTGKVNYIRLKLNKELQYMVKEYLTNTVEFVIEKVEDIMLEFGSDYG